MPTLVCHRCYNKLPHTLWLKTRLLCYRVILRVGSPMLELQWGSRQGYTSSRRLLHLQTQQRWLSPSHIPFPWPTVLLPSFIIKNTVCTLSAPACASGWPSYFRVILSATLAPAATWMLFAMEPWYSQVWVIRPRQVWRVGGGGLSCLQ